MGRAKRNPPLAVGQTTPAAKPPGPIPFSYPSCQRRYSASHTTCLYPLSIGGLALPGDSPARVREERDDYRPFSRTLTDYTDLVNEKLPKVRAVALLLREPQHLPPDSIEEAGVLIADFIDDVRGALSRELLSSIQLKDDVNGVMLACNMQLSPT